MIPTIGRLEFLTRAVDSALGEQEHFADYEIVVLDNCSTDGTWDYLQRMESSRVRTFRTARRLSKTENWNAAVRLCAGDFIHVLQDDNILLPTMLATVSKRSTQLIEPVGIQSARDAAGRGLVRSLSSSESEAYRRRSGRGRDGG